MAAVEGDVSVENDNESETEIISLVLLISYFIYYLIIKLKQIIKFLIPMIWKDKFGSKEFVVMQNGKI